MDRWIGGSYDLCRPLEQRGERLKDGETVTPRVRLPNRVPWDLGVGE